MGRVDLHMHSIYSDGCNTPEEIIMIAKRKGLTTIALTDHDNIMGAKELQRLNKLGINVYSGVELTAKVPKGRMHILGYNIDLEDYRLNKKLNEMHDVAIYNILLYTDLLKKNFGIIIPNEYLDRIISMKGNVGRPQLALALVDMGLCKDVDEAFQKYLNYVYEKARCDKKGLTKEEAIDLIVNAGGIASLAHPGSLLMDDNELMDEVEKLRSIGLRAIETIHTNNPYNKREYYHELAMYFNLLETGGTDYHGYDVKPDVEMATGRDNNVIIDEDTLSFILKVRNRY